MKNSRFWALISYVLSVKMFRLDLNIDIIYLNFLELRFLEFFIIFFKFWLFLVNFDAFYVEWLCVLKLELMQVESKQELEEEISKSPWK